MGQELECRLHYRQRTAAGKAYLERDHLLFRGPERLKIALKDLTGVTASAGTLTLEFAGGPAALELGAAAEKWMQKILHPPSRADKLGVKAGLAVRLVGDFEAGFIQELREREVELLDEKSTTKADLIFFAAADQAALPRIGKLADGMKPAGGLWVVYPKGVTAIREIQVIEAGRAAGLKDVKVTAFSATHTALRFVIPVAAR